MPELPLYIPQTGIRLPRVSRVRQRFDTTRLNDIETAVRDAIGQYASDVIRPNMRVAITAGSRGIAEIVRITAAVVAEVRRLGAEPFIVTAMGSHGGATTDGQRTVLASYGVTEEQVGCPIIATMETVILGTTETGVSVHFDATAYRADAIILLNRVKPHSILTGDLGSGLMKIAAIGLGNHVGAASIHAAGLVEHLLPVARVVLAKAPIKLGLAIVENSFDQVWKIEGVPSSLIEAADRRLLAEARDLMPNIPFDPIDVLVVDQIGKNISGTGMDPNVIGMHRRIGGPATRRIGRIVALGLSPESHGNANGVGMADIITRNLRDAIDWPITWANALTADFLEGLKLPTACPTAREAIALAVRTHDSQRVRLVRVRDTAHLDELWVSTALLDEVRANPKLELIDEPTELTFE
ncbi:MAG: lactate racemase domain-containing protein [Roseiflexaceae bacterium]|nr:lactate racemase domain-containing protein [Roseiflexaceae bacterium]